ncbi:MAG: hypothetical protein AAGA16_25345 [Cyanobacteria bacterium P01_E01_bin.35]
MTVENRLFKDIVNHDLYFAIATDNLEIAIHIDKKIEEGRGTLGTGSKITLGESICLEKKRCKAATVSFVFATLAVEAFINHYA